ncbi:MAG: hypothetical protein LBH69_01300 [Methanomassiliicoccaceae archaeon]|nr:hypothetical protein [Methanomassiliicoccaceae archaeon]
MLYMIVHGHSDAEISGETGVPRDTVSSLRERVARNEHKRQPPIRP